MDVFGFRDELVAEYSRFSRSFTRIRAEDISLAVDAAYAAGRFWPAPPIQLNPSFEPGEWIDDLVSDGTIDAHVRKDLPAQEQGRRGRQAPPSLHTVKGRDMAGHSLRSRPFHGLTRTRRETTTTDAS